MIIAFAILTWILPSGQFDRQLVDTAAGEREVAVAGTYHVIDKVTESGDLIQGLHEVLMAPTRGIQAAADVVVIRFTDWWYIPDFNKDKCNESWNPEGYFKIKRKRSLLIPILMILLGIGGTTFGMSEEVIPFYVMLIPIFFAMGYDSMTTFMIVFLGPQIGYAASTTNPFNVLIAQGVAGIHGNPQLVYRYIWWQL